jgi:hypothetical protein
MLRWPIEEAHGAAPHETMAEFGLKKFAFVSVTNCHETILPAELVVTNVLIKFELIVDEP